MDRTDQIKNIRCQWEGIAVLQLAVPALFSAEERHQFDESFKESDQRHRVEALRLQEKPVYDAASVFQSAEDDFSGDDVFDDSEDVTLDLRQHLYGSLCIQLATLNALPVAFELLEALSVSQVVIGEAAYPGSILVERAVGTAIEWFSKHGLMEMAWAFVEAPLFENGRGIELALLIPPITKDNKDMKRARCIVQRDALRYWEHPDLKLRVNAVCFWADFWRVSGEDADIQQAVALCGELPPDQRAHGYLVIARYTRHPDDILQAWEAIQLLPKEQERIIAAQRVIRDMTLHLLETHHSEFTEYEKTVRDVARRMTNRRWSRVLLAKLKPYFRSDR